MSDKRPVIQICASLGVSRGQYYRYLTLGRSMSVDTMRENPNMTEYYELRNEIDKMDLY